VRAEPATSYVYPSRLLFWRSERLLTSADVLTLAMRAIRERLKVAMGIGTGIHDSSGSSETHRGKLLRMSDAGVALFGFRWAFVLTEHAYSLQERWQIVAPIFGPAAAVQQHDLAV
jgi:hypothetical protein